ncbi:MAG TPA: RCC1 domain-containing protein [Thermoleophilaceae bacterium]|nr:RCC1 domain-containing protein [Thermoleophilaceae bacterium]
MDRFVTRGSRATTDLQAGEWLNGMRQSVVRRLRRGSVERTPAQLVSAQVRSDGSATVVLARKVAPRIGQVLVVPAGGRASRGVLGRVIKRTAIAGGRVRVATVPVALDRAYARLQVALDGTLGTLAAGKGASASAKAGKKLAPGFECKGSVSKPVNVSVDLSNVELDATLDTNFFNPQIGMSLVGNNIPISVSAGFSRTTTCTPRRVPSIYVPIPYTPLGIDIAPAFKASATGALTVDYSTRARMAYGFHRARRGPNSDGPRSFKLDPATPQVNGQAKFELQAGIETSLSLSKVVGIGGSVGPRLTATVSGTSNICAKVNAGAYAALHAKADVFFSSWNFTLWQGNFGDAEIFNRCWRAGVGGGGNGPGAGGTSGGEDDSEPTGPAEASWGESSDLTTSDDYGCALRVGSILDCFGDTERAFAPTGAFKQVSAGGGNVCGLRQSGTLVCGQYLQAPSGSFTSVSVGEYGYACAVRVSGRLVCFGSDYPSPPDGLFTQISASYGQACAIRRDGTVACWGQGHFGQSFSPPEGIFRQVSVGTHAACGVRPDNRVTCWNETSQHTWSGTYKLVDSGSGIACALRTDDTARCAGPISSYNPGLAFEAPSGTFTALSADEIACGKRPDGTIRCWGGTLRGQVRPPTETYEGLFAADWFTCGMRTGAAVTCWGNQDGAATAPYAVGRVWRKGAASGSVDGVWNFCGITFANAVECLADDESPAGSFSDIAVAGASACAVRADDGALECWKRSGFSGTVPSPPAGSFAQVVGHSSNTAFLSEGTYCGRRTSGLVKCWGKYAADPPGTYTDVDAYWASGCGVRSDATLYCWHGPQEAGPRSPPSGSFSDVTVGMLHACALRTNGQVACWGTNAQEQLEVPSGQFKAIEAGDRHTCGLRADGRAECWGDATY